jgi:hypothetical protein
MDEFMKMSIVILNYNTYEMTLNLISNIENICKDKNIDIVIVDNCSQNESTEVLQKESKNNTRYKFIKSEHNGGYATGNNIGIKYAIDNDADYILVSNNDIEIESFDVIEKMLRLMEDNERIGAVSPRIVSKDGRKDPPIYFEKPTFWDLTLGSALYHKKRWYVFDENRNCQIYAPRGSFMLLRAEMMEKIGLLDEKTFLYYEEPILAERLDSIGAECWLCGETQVIHNHGKTIKTVIKKKKTYKIVCDSYEYYLRQYRKMNILLVGLCVGIRKIGYLLNVMFSGDN